LQKKKNGRYSGVASPKPDRPFKIMNTFETEFLADCESTKAEFSAIVKKFPNRSVSLLSTWAEDKGVDSRAAEWAFGAIKKIQASAKLEKPIETPAAETEDEDAEPAEMPLTVSVEETAAPVTPAEFVDIDVEVMEADVVSAPHVEKGDMGFRAISQALSVTCQKVVIKDVASVVHDAQSGRMALPPLFFSGFAGLGKTYTLDLISALLPNFKRIELPPGFSATAFKKALVENCHKSFIFFIDEFHDMDGGIRNILKALTETNGKIKDFNVSIGGSDYTITIDPRKHWFIGASNEPIKDSALVGQSGRFRDCQFLPYDDKGKTAILTALCGKYLPGVPLSTPIKNIIARNTRPFARSLKMMLERLWTELKHGADLGTEAGVKDAIKNAGYFPGGWRKEHTDVLTFLAATEQGRQVQEIAAGPMRGASTKQASALLAELMQGDLIVTMGNGRKAATAAAVKLLKTLEKK
jgi:Holliday junction resolvasome RuvABC ATP-dependent DNA helicase subunit